jgi:hypothetical protein
MFASDGEVSLADLSDVEAALVGAAIAALYPLGLDQPSAVGSPIRIFRGWPAALPLETDLLAGVANVGIFSMPGTGRNTTRWNVQPSVTPGLATLMVDVVAGSATFFGVGGLGQVAGLLVDEQAFVYRGCVGDTPALVAAMLAQAVRAVRPCWLSGCTVTIPGSYRLVGRVVADGLTLTELARQEQGFRVSVWCPNPGLRDQICSALGSAFSAISFLDLADGSSGRLRYRSTDSSDDLQDAHQYRRDILYNVEYGTISREASPSMLFGDLTWAGETLLA